MTYQIVSERRAEAYRISSPADGYKAFSRYAKARTERFLVAVLNSGYEVIRVAIVSDWFSESDCRNAFGGFLPLYSFRGRGMRSGHNHPSGRLDPSAEDIESTRRLRECGDLLNISVLDHLIVGPKGGYYSIYRHGLLPPPRPD